MHYQGGAPDPECIFCLEKNTDAALEIKDFKKQFENLSEILYPNNLKMIAIVPKKIVKKKKVAIKATKRS